MRGLDRKSTSAFLATSCPWLVVLTLLPPPSASAKAWPRVLIADYFVTNTVKRALDGAAKRLGAPGCAEVFSSPTLLDQEGRPLLEKLAELQTDGPAYLDRLSFYDGSNARTCQQDDVLAFTTVGTTSVFICGPRFLAQWRRGPDVVELAIIHEALHTLGLGENPPTSRAISNVVHDHCHHVSRADKE